MAPTVAAFFFGPENRLVTLKLIKYSLLVLFAPLATFYGMFFLVFKQDKSMMGWCGIAAVVSANLVIASYVFMAWNEVDPDAKQRINKERVD